MVKKTPINCLKCGTFVGNAEDYMYMVIQQDLKCLKCGEVVICANVPVFNVVK